MYDQFNKLIESQKGADYPLPNKEVKGAQKIIEELSATTVEQMAKKQTKDQFPACFNSVNFSSFNPAPAVRKMAGDLFYLTVKTLDVGERGITCCANGFYLNNN